MKIMHIGKYYFPFSGGIENFMKSIINSQVSSGHDVSAIVHSHQAGQYESVEKHFNFTLYRLPIIGMLLFVPLPRFGFFKLHKIISIEAPDVLHLHMPNVTCFWLLFLLQARRIPWVLHWHSDVLGERPDWRIKLLYPFYRLFEQALLKCAARVIVTSSHYLNSSLPLAKWRDKCDVVPLAVELDDDAEQKAVINSIPNSTAGVLKLITIGRLTYYKGHQYLLLAVKQLHEVNIPVKLTIIGEGELLESLNQQTQSLGLSQFVTFTGKVNDKALKDLLKVSDLLCLPSIERTEAFGLVLLEAMQLGKPCIVTDVPGSGMNYVVEHNKTGLVVERANPEAIADGVRYLDMNRELLAQMGEAGRHRVQEHFTIQRVTQQIESVYDKALSSNS